MRSSMQFLVSAKFWLVAIVVAVFLVIGCNGCKKPKPPPSHQDNVKPSSDKEDKRPYLFIILLDETGVEDMNWNNTLEYVVQVINSMKSRDALVVIGIDDDSDSRDGSDTRIPLTELPDTKVPDNIPSLFRPKKEKELIREMEEKKSELINKVLDLKERIVIDPNTRKRRKGSDILGALRLGFYLARQKSSSHKFVVIGFTDLEALTTDNRFLCTNDERKIQEAIKAAKKYKYPKGTEGAFFYLKPDRREIVEFYWEKVLTEMCINVQPKNDRFFLLESMKNGLSTFLNDIRSSQQ